MQSRDSHFDLTVAICVFNGGKYIEETLQSLHRQRFQDFELLIIDDASTDDTPAIVRRFLDKYRGGSGTLVSLASNGGLARARKVGENLIETELALFFDADDVAEPAMLETLYEVLKREPDCIGVSCYCRYIDSASKPIGGGIYLGPRTKEESLNKARQGKLMFLPPATMFRLAYAKSAGGRAVDGFPEGRIRYQDMCEDLDLWTRMSDRFIDGKYFLVVPRLLFRYRKHAASVSSSSRAMNDRIRHIKSNVRRRRAGLEDQPFLNYAASLSPRERVVNLLHDLSSDHYKHAGFRLMQKSYVRFAGNLLIATACSPRYVLDKLRNNVFRLNQAPSE